MPSDQQTTRGGAVRAARQEGETWGSIAKRFGVSKETARRYVSDPRKRDPAFDACRRKQSHQTEAAAEGALGRLRAEGTQRALACRVYRCPHCAGFHVGAPPREQSANAC